jgi:hypothetical protein
VPPASSELCYTYGLLISQGDSFTKSPTCPSLLLRVCIVFGVWACHSPVRASFLREAMCYWASHHHPHTDFLGRGRWVIRAQIVFHTFFGITSTTPGKFKSFHNMAKCCQSIYKKSYPAYEALTLTSHPTIIGKLHLR